MGTQNNMVATKRLKCPSSGTIYLWMMVLVDMSSQAFQWKTFLKKSYYFQLEKLTP